MSLWCDLTEITRLKWTKGYMPACGEFFFSISVLQTRFVFGNPKLDYSSFIPESLFLPVQLDFSLAGSITVHAVHFEVGFAVLFDQRSRDESHESDGKELGQRPPGEDIIQGGDLQQDGARADTDEVVGDQTWRRKQQRRDQCLWQ